MDLFKPAADRSQPQLGYMARSVAEADAELRRYAAVLGTLAGLTPVLVLALAWGAALWTGGAWCWRDSLSHFYYAPAGANLFVILLSLTAGALVFYRGENRTEGRLATLAGLAMLVVAFVPTSGGGCSADEMQARIVTDLVRDGGPWRLAAEGPIATAAGEGETLFFALGPSVWVHYGAATVLFAVLALFCFRIFTRIREARGDRPPEAVDVLPDGSLKPAKRLRNRLYRVAGGVIVAVMLAATARLFLGEDWVFWDAWNVTFWLETVGLAAFGGSWLVKGRFFAGLLENR